MIKNVKKVAALVLAAVVVMTCFVGCTPKYKHPVSSEDVVMLVGETKVKADIATFYLRYNQSLMESLYGTYIGENVWTQEVSEGQTYEDSLKDSIIEELKELYIVTNHVADYKVALTDEEKAAIEEAANSFLSENKAEDLEKICGGKEVVVEYLTLQVLNTKMSEAMKNDINSEITTEEAKQKRARYYKVETVTELDDGSKMNKTDDEIAQAKKDAEAFLAGAKEKGSMESYATEKSLKTSTLTFNADSEALDASVIKAADALKEGEFSEVIEVKEDGYYVLQLESLHDEIATEKAKEEMKIERQEARYKELVEKWTEETTVTVYEEVWGEISVRDLKVIYTYDPEETTDTTTEE